MHTKLSVHQKWCTLNSVCITWGPHENYGIWEHFKQGTWEIIGIIEIIEIIEFVIIKYVYNNFQWFQSALLGGSQVMHTKLSVHQKWCTLNLVCITWDHPRKAEIKKNMGGSQVMHTKCSGHQKWCTLNFVCITWDPPCFFCYFGLPRGVPSDAH